LILCARIKSFKLRTNSSSSQDILEQKIAIENVSYYAAPGQEMSEIEFFNAVVSEADCDVLLDLNNIYMSLVATVA
jgi:uncharacterized protein (UPF0276 family)